MVRLLEYKHPAGSVLADLPGRTYRLPFHSDTDWRPDIVICGHDHTVEFVELTVPFEPNRAAAHGRKTTKYAPLLAQAKGEGMRPTLSCIEMGSRGLSSPAWDTWVVSSRLPRAVTRDCAALAMRASHVVWLHKATTWPNPPLLELAAGKGPVSL